MRSGKWGVNFAPEETAEAGQIIRQLGGYEQALRLERELAEYDRSGIPVRMEKDEGGKLRLIPTAVR